MRTFVASLIVLLFVTIPAYADERAQAELLLWETIKDTSNPKMFNEYLKQFPEGVFSGIARIRLEELMDEIKTEIAPGDEPASVLSEPEFHTWIEAEIWMKAEAELTPEAYQDYIKQFPDGMCLNVARIRLAEAQLWQDIKQSSNPMVVKEFIESYPNSPFVRKAVERFYLISGVDHRVKSMFDNLIKAKSGEVKKCNIQ